MSAFKLREKRNKITKWTKDMAAQVTVFQVVGCIPREKWMDLYSSNIGSCAGLQCQV